MDIMEDLETEETQTAPSPSSTKFKLISSFLKFFQTCGCSLSPSSSPRPKPHPTADPFTKPRNEIYETIPTEVTTNHPDSSATLTSAKNLCAICLDPLTYSTSTSPGQAIFTAQCCHSFHFTCISSNVRHGGVTCPICRAQWTQLPRGLNAPSLMSSCNQSTDPVLQILDDSIATFRVNRRSFLRSARYDDDDPIESEHTPNNPRLHLSLLSIPLSHQPSLHSCFHNMSEPDICHLCEVSSQSYFNMSSSSLSSAAPSPPPAHHFDPVGGSPSLHSRAYYLSIRLAHQPATDLVLVATPNGAHLRLMKQYMTLVVFSMRPIDRLAIVAYSSSAARIFPLRRMTSYGKRTALQVIDRILFYMGQADPIEGLKKGVKILKDRTHENLESCILHLFGGGPTTSYHGFDMEIPIPIHRFHVGYGFGSWNGFLMHGFEEFLARVLGGCIRDIQLRIRDNPGNIVRLSELRGGEERRIPLNSIISGTVCVDYSYVEGGVHESIQTGQILVRLESKRERNEVVDNGRSSSATRNWDYHDSYMARRWAKHLHGYRLN